MPFRSALPSPTSDQQPSAMASEPMHRGRRPSLRLRVRHGLILALLASTGTALAHQGTSGARVLSWSGMVGQAENTKALESSKLDPLRRHTLGEQSVLGDGSQQTFDVHADPNAAVPSELNFERSFLLEIPEPADRESLERRHDENG